jgi:hypothetical protein
MIAGLKLTMTGEELQGLMSERATAYRASAARWLRERDRTTADQTEDEPLLPDHICANEAERLEWRADVLEFVRDHLEPLEIYRLGEADLDFAEVLPPKPGWLEQDEYEERTRAAFGLERIARRICSHPEIIEITNPYYRPETAGDSDK